MKKDDNKIIQKRVSNFITAAGLIVSVTNIVRLMNFRDNSLIQALSNPSVFIVLGFSLLLLLTRKIESPLIQSLHIGVFLANAALALLDGYDTFHGIGFIILALLLAYRYGLLEKFSRIKLIFLGLFTLFFLEYSIHLSGDDQIGSSLNILTYLIFFLSLIYLIYMSEIKKILRVEKVYKESLSALESEKENLNEEIGLHKTVIQEKESRLVELEQQISRMKADRKPLDFTEYKITPREEVIIREFCLQPQLTNKEIAYNLNMTTGTVKQHFNNIFRKMAIHSRQELLDICRWNF